MGGGEKAAAVRQVDAVIVGIDAAVAEVQEVLNSIGDTCPECPPE